MTPDRLERPPPERKRGPGQGAARLANNNNPERHSRHQRGAQGSAADFCLAHHLLHERLLPPLGYGWLFFRKDGSLSVHAAALDTLSLDIVPLGAA